MATLYRDRSKEPFEADAPFDRHGQHHQSYSPLESLVRQTSLRARGLKSMPGQRRAGSDRDASVTSSSRPRELHIQPPPHASTTKIASQAHTSPEKSTARLRKAPSSPLLHTRFRSSTATTTSDNRGSSGTLLYRFHTSSMANNEGQSPLPLVEGEDDHTLNYTFNGRYDSDIDSPLDHPVLPPSFRFDQFDGEQSERSSGRPVSDASVVLPPPSIRNRRSSIDFLRYDDSPSALSFGSISSEYPSPGASQFSLSSPRTNQPPLPKMSSEKAVNPPEASDTVNNATRTKASSSRETWASTASGMTSADPFTFRNYESQPPNKPDIVVTSPTAQIPSSELPMISPASPDSPTGGGRAPSLYTTGGRYNFSRPIRLAEAPEPPPPKPAFDKRESTNSVDSFYGYGRRFPTPPKGSYPTPEPSVSTQDIPEPYRSSPPSRMSPIPPRTNAPSSSSPPEPSRTPQDPPTNRPTRPARPHEPSRSALEPASSFPSPAPSHRTEQSEPLQSHPYRTNAPSPLSFSSRNDTSRPAPSGPVTTSRSPVPPRGPLHPSINHLSPTLPSSNVGRSQSPHGAMNQIQPPTITTPGDDDHVSVYSNYSFYALPDSPNNNSSNRLSPQPGPSGRQVSPEPQSRGIRNLRGPSKSGGQMQRNPTRSVVSPTHVPHPRTAGYPQASTPEEYLQLGIQHHEADELPLSAYCFEQSAKAGGGCGIGMLMWGLTLRHGWGVQKDEKRGFVWVRRAAEAAVEDLEAAMGGVDYGAVQSELVLAIYEVGQCYSNGWGVAQDKKMAVSYFQVAARLGDSDAQQELGFCLANGKGCKKDKKEAAKWYRAAVAQGVSTVGLAWIFKDKYN